MADQSRIAHATRRRQCVEDRLGGLTPPEIAQKRSLHLRTVKRLLAEAETAETERTKAGVEQLRQVHAARVEAIFQRLWDNIDDPAVLAQVIRLLEREARLWGLDAPKEHRHEVDVVERHTVVVWANDTLGFAGQELAAALRETLALVPVELHDELRNISERHAHRLLERAEQHAAELDPGSVVESHLEEAV